MTNEIQFKHVTPSKRIKRALKLDLRRLFTTKYIYIMLGVALVMPILILVMTSMNTGDQGTGTFTSTWQAIGSANSSSAMDLTSMCNINMIYFLFLIVGCIFISDEYKSGYVKNIFTLRSMKYDYIVSKLLTITLLGSLLLIMYTIGAIIGGGIAGLSFETDGFTVGNLILCIISKLFLTAFFSGIILFATSVGKEKMWISIVALLGFNMLFFNIIPLITPITSSFMNVILTFAGGLIFQAGFGALANLVLNKTNLI